MERIIQWLQSDQNYFQGLALLNELSKNRMLLLSLTRKANPGKLLYELKKMVPKHSAEVKPVKAAKAAPPLPSPRLRILRNQQQVNLEELPPRLQRLYLTNVELYKKMRALHERSKLIQEDSLRAPVVQQLVKMDSQVRQNWAVIDGWDGQPDVPGGAIDHRRINANRKLITYNRKKLDALPPGRERDELKSRMQQRIDELLAAGEQFSKIKNDLLNQGFKL